MGAEWERKRAEGFKKGLDKRLIELGTPDLFTMHPERAPRVAMVDIEDGISVNAGDNLVIQKLGGCLAVLSGLRKIGEVNRPHSEIVSAVENSFGYAKGIVRAFHQEALVAEISVC